jgi:hypothetical protein
MTRDEKIFKLGKKITDRAAVLLGKEKITKESPEYWGINAGLSKFEADADLLLDVALVFDKRKPITLEQVHARIKNLDIATVEDCVNKLARIGLLEFHWENLDGKNPRHEKRWVLDMFVPGSAEIMIMDKQIPAEHPETADFFERMAYLPLAGITELVPPGGAGIGMHVIPVEKAIPTESQSVDIEHLSHWLKKYEGQIGVGVCSCRKQQRILFCLSTVLITSRPPVRCVPVCRRLSKALKSRRFREVQSSGQGNRCRQIGRLLCCRQPGQKPP